jgi:hypothetical protein
MTSASSGCERQRQTLALVLSSSVYGLGSETPANTQFLAALEPDIGNR